MDAQDHPDRRRGGGVDSPAGPHRDHTLSVAVDLNVFIADFVELPNRLSAPSEK